MVWAWRSEENFGVEFSFSVFTLAWGSNSGLQDYTANALAHQASDLTSLEVRLLI